MIKTFERETVLTYSVMPPLYIPFRNAWGQNVYTTYSPFDLDPFTIMASSTSGSPVLIAGDCFFGFLNASGGHFAYDGAGTLTVTCPAGQALYHTEGTSPYQAWLDYSAEVAKSFPERHSEAFWSDLEYCTWVDQKHEAILRGISAQSAITEQFVYDYMRRVKALGLPPGKLTIDDGWDIRKMPDGRRVQGNWEIDREKFPHMEQLVRDMVSEGFTPGIWFAPFTATPTAKIAQEHPEVLGGFWDQKSENGDMEALRFFLPSEALRPYYTEIFSKYIGMGFRKVKLDMSYGPKHEMIALLRMIDEVIKSIDESVEVEAHIPDIFASRCCDVVRINDVAFDDGGRWRGVTQGHYYVCRYSSPDRVLNLDHLGTNTPTPRAKDFLEHTRMLLKLKGGYPCVSLLPDRFLEDPAVSEEFVALVKAWHASNSPFRDLK